MGSEPIPASAYPWTVLLIGVPDFMAEECEAAASPIPCHRVAAKRGALDEILSRRPIVVIVGPGADVETLESARVRASAVRAVLVELSLEWEGTSLEETLRAAIIRAESARTAARARRMA